MRPVIILYTTFIFSVYRILGSKESLTEPAKGTDENKAKRDELIKTIRIMYRKLKARGITLAEVDTTQSLKGLTAYRKELRQKLIDTKSQTDQNKPNETRLDKTKCRKMASKNLWDKYDWTSRVMNKNVWKCPSGWQNTGCSWGMGSEFEKKQCRRKKSGRTSEDKNEGRSDAINKLITEIRLQEAAIKALGVTPKGSNRFIKSNVTEDELLKRLNVLKLQLEELRANAPKPSSDPGQTTAASVTDDSEMKKLIIEGIKAKLKKLENMGIYPKGGNSVTVDLNSFTIDQLNKRSHEFTLQILNAPAVVEWKLPTIDINRILGYCGNSGGNNDAPSKTKTILNRTLEYVGDDAFVIVTWTGKGGDATGYAHKFHLECGANSYTSQTRGYDVYIWAPGAKGRFVHRNDPGWGSWGMSGGKFSDSWRSGTDKSIVDINN